VRTNLARILGHNTMMGGGMMGKPEAKPDAKPDKHSQHH